MRTRISWVGEGREKLSSGARFECAGGCGKSGDAGWAREWIDVPQSPKWTRPRRIEKSVKPFLNAALVLAAGWSSPINWAKLRTYIVPTNYLLPTHLEGATLAILPQAITYLPYLYVVGEVRQVGWYLVR